jgi:hypothetical protein
VRVLRSNDVAVRSVGVGVGGHQRSSRKTLCVSEGALGADARTQAHNGYVASSKGKRYTVAFKDAHSAVSFAMRLQVRVFVIVWVTDVSARARRGHCWTRSGPRSSIAHRLRSPRRLQSMSARCELTFVVRARTRV